MSFKIGDIVYHSIHHRYGVIVGRQTAFWTAIISVTDEFHPESKVAWLAEFLTVINDETYVPSDLVEYSRRLLKEQLKPNEKEDTTKLKTIIDDLINKLNNEI
jgi:hypothetical protein